MEYVKALSSRLTIYPSLDSQLLQLSWASRQQVWYLFEIAGKNLRLTYHFKVYFCLILNLTVCIMLLTGYLLIKKTTSTLTTRPATLESLLVV